MKMLKSLGAVLCMVILLSIVPTAAPAKASLNILEFLDLSALGDTMNLTQDDYLAVVEKTKSQSSSEEHIIEVTCKIFLALGRAYVRDPEAYDCTSLINADSMDNKTIQYLLSRYKYLSALYETYEWEMLWDDLKFEDFNINISGDRANASVIESYIYFLDNDFQSESGLRRQLDFELLLGPDGWKITDVRRKNLETQEGFDYTPIDVEAVIAKLIEEERQVKQAPETDKIDEAGEDKPETPNEHKVSRVLYTITAVLAPLVLYFHNYRRKKPGTPR